MNIIEINEMATRIAKDIFEMGSDPGTNIFRIEFKSLKGGEEQGHGGLCLEPLIKVIIISLLKSDFNFQITEDD